MKLIRQDWQFAATKWGNEEYWDVTWELDGDTCYVSVYCDDDLAWRGIFKAGQPDVTSEQIPRDEWPEAVRNHYAALVELSRKAVR